MFYSARERFLPEETRFGHSSVMLASAKEGLYHPHLPTFRRMDMDTVSQKLPYEHCRTTTALTKDDFRHAAVTLFKKTKRPLPEEISLERDTQEIERPTTENADRTSSSVGFRLEPISRPRPLTHGGDLRRINREKLGELIPAFRKEPDASSFSAGKYKYQYIPPHVPAEKYSKVHFVDWTGIRPIPANTYSRYRDAHPMYSENISSRSWRP